MARLQADTGDIDGALAMVDAEVAKKPQDHEAWQIKGDLLLRGKRDADGALAAYRQSIAAKPNNILAHSGAMTILLAKQDAEGAKAQLAQLQKVLPGNPQTVYFEGSLALLEKDYDKAHRDFAEAAARRSRQPAHPAAGRRGRVPEGLDGAGRGPPGEGTAGGSRVRHGPPAADADLPAHGAAGQGAEHGAALAGASRTRTRARYALAAQAHLQSGEIEEAEKAFAQAAKLNPDDTRSKTAVAVTQVLQGETDAGLSALQALASDDKDATADLPLIATLVRKKDYAGALKAIDALEKKQPDTPVAANLRARVLLLRGDRAGAVKAFEQALKIQPSFFPAANALALLALADKKPVEAKKYLDDVLKADPEEFPGPAGAGGAEGT